MDKQIADITRQLDSVADSQRTLVDLQVETVRFLQLFQNEQRQALAAMLDGMRTGKRPDSKPVPQPSPVTAPAPAPTQSTATAPASAMTPARPAATWAETASATPPAAAEMAAAAPATAVTTWESTRAVVPSAPLQAAAPVPVKAKPVAPAGIDIVVPVYNSLHHARLCIESVLDHATAPFTLTIVNDCSDSHTRAELDRMVADNAGAPIRLIHHDTNAGYLSSVNEAIAATASDICLLLNSDAILSPGTCERLRAGFASDDKIGVISAVSTWANWTKIPFPAGTTRLDLQDYVANAPTGALADIGNASGFFFAVRRSLFAELGLFDKAYHPGYWEEADFCMAAMKAGYRVTVDLQLYIYHHGWGSFQKTGRDEHMERNRHVFMARWQAPYAQLEHRWRANNPVVPLIASLAGAPRHRKAGQPRVLFVSARADTSDDSVALMQLVNALNNRGISANVFYAGAVDERLFDMTPMYFRPITGRPQVEDLTAYDIYVATSPATAVAAQKLAAASKGAAFGFAFDASETLPDMRAILRGTGNGAGPDDTVALPGINLDLFYPRDGSRGMHILSRVTDAAWEKHGADIVAFHEKLADIHPDLDTGVIGPAEIGARLPDVRHHGEPHRMQQRAELLSQARMVIDWDGAEGGRMTFLEAAACGCVPVILADLGEGEASIDMEHCVMANRGDIAGLVERLAALAVEPEAIAARAGKARTLALANALTTEAATLAKVFRQVMAPAGVAADRPSPDVTGADGRLALRAS